MAKRVVANGPKIVQKYPWLGNKLFYRHMKPDGTPLSAYYMERSFNGKPAYPVLNNFFDRGFIKYGDDFDLLLNTPVKRVPLKEFKDYYGGAYYNNTTGLLEDGKIFMGPKLFGSRNNLDNILTHEIAHGDQHRLGIKGDNFIIYYNPNTYALGGYGSNINPEDIGLNGDIVRLNMYDFDQPLFHALGYYKNSNGWLGEALSNTSTVKGYMSDPLDVVEFERLINDPKNAEKLISKDLYEINNYTFPDEAFEHMSERKRKLFGHIL